ncbi:MAG TPA: DUF547 domain-containing protein [Rariglobus sp.]
MIHRLSLRFLLCCLLVPVALLAQDAPPALPAPYPTAGGAGGKVIVVTSLADSGPGTLREALNAKEPRIIRFGLAGEIWLKDKLVFNSPFVTVEGESSPPPGITLMGDKLRIRAHDVIIRNIRVRVGALLTNSDPQNRDGIAIEGSQDGRDPNYNVLVENCSVMWAIDENIQIWGKGSHDIVVRNCIIAEGLSKGHPKGGTHSAGLIVGPDTRNVLVQGNLFAHNAFRNPVAGGGSESTILNNLVYNPGFGGFMVYNGGDQSTQPTKTNVVGNVLIAGADTIKRPIETYHRNGINAGSLIYYKDNVAVGVEAYRVSEKAKAKGGAEFNPVGAVPPIPIDHANILPSSAVEAYVLAHAGAFPDRRDAVDTRIISDVKARSGRIPGLPSDERLHPQAIAFGGAMESYAKLMGKYVTPKGVRYAAWKQSSDDLAALQKVVDDIAQSKQDNLAFYLNAYNVWVLRKVLQNYPLKSVAAEDSPFFEASDITVGGRTLSLNALEKEITDRFHDLRTVFVLNRASLGGPDLSPVPFSQETINVQLDQLTGAFINSPKAIRDEGSRLAISKLFDWKKAQMPEGAMPVFFKYSHTHPKEKPIVYQIFDWALNEVN